MPYGFLDIAGTPSVKAAQAANGSAALWGNFQGDRTRDRFTEAEVAFIAQRDSLYMATVSETGWPYVQHRGGPPGFLRVLDDRTLAFADFRGNRQYISLGNLAANDRVALILMDYPHRRRLKIYAHIEARDLTADPDLAEKLAVAGYKGRPERAFVLHLDAFDWNCPQLHRGGACRCSGPGASAPGGAGSGKRDAAGTARRPVVGRISAAQSADASQPHDRTIPQGAAAPAGASPRLSLRTQLASADCAALIRPALCGRQLRTKFITKSGSLLVGVTATGLGLFGAKVTDPCGDVTATKSSTGLISCNPSIS